MVLAALAIVVVFLQWASPLLSPILLALFIAVVASGPLHWLQHRGLPKWFALAAVVFVLLDVGSLFALLTAGTLEGLRDSLPTYQERLRLLAERLGLWLESVGLAESPDAIVGAIDPAAVTRMVRIAIASIKGTLSTGFLVLLAVVFMLLEAAGLPAKLRAAFQPGPEIEERLRRAVRSVNRYMVIKTLTSLATAALVFAWLWLLGVEFAVLWAIFAFVFNFVPFVGAVLMLIPPTLLALVQIDVATALLVAAGFVVINTLIGSIIEPRVMGRGLGVSTLAVFLSLLFWGWVFGTVGVVLSVPLTLAAIIALDASPHTRPLAILLGPEMRGAPPSAPPAGDVAGGAEPPAGGSAGG